MILDWIETGFWANDCSLNHTKIRGSLLGLIERDRRLLSRNALMRFDAIGPRPNVIKRIRERSFSVSSGADGFEAAIHHEQMVMLAEFKNQIIRDSQSPLMNAGLYDRVIYRISQKLQGPEQGTLTAADLALHESEYARLTTELESAYQHSTLPEMPSAEKALNDLLVRLRLHVNGVDRDSSALPHLIKN